jgi:hypothetical protein
MPAERVLALIEAARQRHGCVLDARPGANGVLHVTSSPRHAKSAHSSTFPQLPGNRLGARPYWVLSGGSTEGSNTG